MKLAEILNIDIEDVDHDDIISSETDDRGRLTLGAGYADQDVTVLVVDRESDAQSDEQSTNDTTGG